MHRKLLGAAAKVAEKKTESASESKPRGRKAKADDAEEEVKEEVVEEFDAATLKEVYNNILNWIKAVPKDEKARKEKLTSFMNSIGGGKVGEIKDQAKLKKLVAWFNEIESEDSSNTEEDDI